MAILRGNRYGVWDMNEASKIQIRFEEEGNLRASDLMPGEGCLYQGVVYIKLGWGDVELHPHVPDEYRLAAGEEGMNKKKQFFFRPDTYCVTTLLGGEKVYPVDIELIVKRFTLNQVEKKCVDGVDQPKGMNARRAQSPSGAQGL